MGRSDIDQKALDVFPGRVVWKDLVQEIKAGQNVPTYVLEYLIGQYCAADDEESIESGLEMVKKILAEVNDRTQSNPASVAPYIPDLDRRVEYLLRKVGVPVLLVGVLPGALPEYLRGCGLAPTLDRLPGRRSGSR